MTEMNSNNLTQNMEFEAFQVKPMVKDAALSNEIFMQIKNASYQTIEDAQLIMMTNIPAGLMLSEVTIIQELNQLIEMLEDGFMEITVDLPKMAPNSSMIVNACIYYAGDLMNPNYTIDSTVYLTMDDEVKDSKAAEVVMVMKPEID
ncbi:hypothetical protein PV797_14885 [Clostridiaceae bacterium M8S5]|nr:hypothetical protein PV797_14885 [Clostridiaceae bacterium M8S5]